MNVSEQETLEKSAEEEIQELTTMTTQIQGKEPVAEETTALQEQSLAAAVVLLPQY